MKALAFFNENFGKAMLNMPDEATQLGFADSVLRTSYKQAGKNTTCRLTTGGAVWIEEGRVELAGGQEFHDPSRITRSVTGGSPMLARRLLSWGGETRVMLLMFSQKPVDVGNLTSTYARDEINLCCPTGTHRTSWGELTRDMTKGETDSLPGFVNKVRGSLRKILKEQSK